ncbi:hypothetical protein AB0N05_25680 [Nocardia sp. NPDC051030]|uniref:hypothetical protein n=1 Tax=Nocardia sp. NPDC051030 TaxID=3155162 RepID=UPI00343A1374
MSSALLRRFGCALVMAGLSSAGVNAFVANAEDIQVLRLEITHQGYCDTANLQAEHGVPTTLNISQYANTPYSSMTFSAPSLHIDRPINTPDNFAVTEVFLGELPEGGTPFQITGMPSLGSSATTVCNGVIESH